MLLSLVKIFIPAVLAFAIGIGITPMLSRILYERKMWKKRAGKRDLDGNETPVFNKLHETREVGVPRLGGVVIWLSASVAVLFTYALAHFFSSPVLSKLDFLSRDQTWIPLLALLLGGCIGFFDDLAEINGEGGLSLRKRLALVGLIGFTAGIWFYLKLDVSAIGLPFYGPFFVGSFLPALFAIVTIGVYSGGIIDGLDGLAGGVFAIIFGAYGAIAFFQNQLNLAAFCAALLGGILAFLWFNIPPARFYMSETGSMALTLTLAVVAFMTDDLGEGEGLAVLPIIALPLVVTSVSAILQLFSKRVLKKKLFHIAPLHHHFEAMGWPSFKVVMRYWVISIIAALMGLIVALAS